MFDKYKKIFIKALGNIKRRRFGWEKQLTKIFKFFYFLIQTPLEFLGDMLFSAYRWKACTCENPKRILIVKIDQFGDVLFSTFMLPLMKAAYPDAKIDYVIHPKTKAVLEKNPHINKIYFWEDIFLYFLLGRKGDPRRNGLKSAKERNAQTFLELVQNNYDVVINTRAYAPSSNIPWRKLKPKCLIAFDISEWSFLAHCSVPYDLYGDEWKNYLNLLNPLGVSKDQNIFHPSFHNTDDGGFWKKFPELASHKHSYIVCSPVSFDPERFWSDENWRMIVSYTQSRYIPIVMTGLPDQKEYLEKLCEKMSQDNLFFATDVTLPEMGSLFAHAKAFVGIDSFPAHLSIASSLETVCLVNTDAYFLHSHSKQGIIDARSMIPLISGVHVVELQKQNAQAVIALLDKIFPRGEKM